ncbi:hypothetical protein DIPPA_04947 [Diplonema papillatum]|nr:hypothetical protein DIPPA_04947 [Diplonema papillatum]
MAGRSPFFGLQMQAGHEYKVQVPEKSILCLTTASIDATAADIQPVSVIAELDESEFVLAHMNSTAVTMEFDVNIGHGVAALLKLQGGRAGQSVFVCGKTFPCMARYMNKSETAESFGEVNDDDDDDEQVPTAAIELTTSEPNVESTEPKPKKKRVKAAVSDDSDNASAEKQGKKTRKAKARQAALAVAA